MNGVLLGFVSIVLIFAGCVSQNSLLSFQNEQSQNNSILSSSPVETFPPHFSIPSSDATAEAVFCTDGTRAQNESCFRGAFSFCTKTIGYFWSVVGESSLVLESFGIDTRTGNCLLRLTPGDEESKYLGMVAYCSIPATPADEGGENYFFDLNNVNDETCTGTLVGLFQKN
jgi:hypothetical protein